MAWEPERKLIMRITDTNLPFELADIESTLRPDEPPRAGGGTVVTVSPVYALLAGLKQHIEAAEVA